MSFPIMAEAMDGMMIQVQFALLNKTQQNFDTIETIKKVAYFLGSLQPLHPRALLVKPEGQRQWKWWKLWTATALPVDSYVMDAQGRQYRVMSSQDWSQASYREYDCVESSTAGAMAP